MENPLASSQSKVVVWGKYGNQAHGTDCDIYLLDCKFINIHSNLFFPSMIVKVEMNLNQPI